MITFSPQKLDKLSDYFMDVAKGLTLASLAVPTLISAATILTTLKNFLTAIVFMYLSLKALELKEVSK
ncbi:MAG TPA: hypothetical protein VLG12_03045 [Candidatus Saccharimonadales bacterium]|nr:hypothetical protein [Candidatus Saccharimonadales bacterium]